MPRTDQPTSRGRTGYPGIPPQRHLPGPYVPTASPHHGCARRTGRSARLAVQRIGASAQVIEAPAGAGCPGAELASSGFNPLGRSAVCSGTVDQSLHFRAWTTNLYAAESLTDAWKLHPVTSGRSPCIVQLARADSHSITSERRSYGTRWPSPVHAVSGCCVLRVMARRLTPGARHLFGLIERGMLSRCSKA